MRHQAGAQRTRPFATLLGGAPHLLIGPRPPHRQSQIGDAVRCFGAPHLLLGQGPRRPRPGRPRRRLQRGGGRAGAGRGQAAGLHASHHRRRASPRPRAGGRVAQSLPGSEHGVWPMIVIAKRPLPSRDVPGPVDAGRKFLRERIEEVDFATSAYGLHWSEPPRGGGFSGGPAPGSTGAPTPFSPRRGPPAPPRAPAAGRGLAPPPPASRTATAASTSHLRF